MDIPHRDRQTCQLLDQLSPEGRVGEKDKIIHYFQMSRDWFIVALASKDNDLDFSMFKKKTKDCTCECKVCV